MTHQTMNNLNSWKILFPILIENKDIFILNFIFENMTISARVNTLSKYFLVDYIEHWRHLWDTRVVDKWMSTNDVEIFSLIIRLSTPEGISQAGHLTLLMYGRDPVTAKLNISGLKHSRCSSDLKPNLKYNLAE